MLQTVLRQIADREARGPDDLPEIGLVEPGEYPQQRGFAGAVRSGQTNAIAVAHLPGDVVEQNAVAEAFGEAGKLDQAYGCGPCGAPIQALSPGPRRNRTQVGRRPRRYFSTKLTTTVITTSTGTPFRVVGE